MNRYYQQVEEAVRATEFHSPTTYSWFGKRSERLPPALRRSLTPRTARGYLLFNLRSQLYADFYCQGFATPTRQEAVDFPAMGMTPFVEALSAANCGSGYWEDGWEVRTTADGKVAVRKGGLELWARPEDCLVPEGGAIASGMQLRLRFPKEYLSISPGFYMVSSEEPLDQANSETLVRMYWNLMAEGAVPFVKNATSMLNRARVPFRLKVVKDPAGFTRCDAAVVYVPKSDYEAAAEILERVYPEVAIGLRQGTPAFTKLLAPGVGLAENPGQGESFGLHRCQLLAEGMVSAHEQGKKSVKERLQAVEDRFAEDGIGLETPFLNPGSSDDYGFQPRLPQQVQFPSDAVEASRTAPGSEALLNTAHMIGRRLSQEAVWHEDRCNWLGAEPVQQSRLSGQPSMTYRALGPELYSGTSGVALFLAELYAATGDAQVRRAALGAIRQALANADTVPPPDRLGFYAGWIGIALAAARVGTILGEKVLLVHAAQLLRRSAGEHHGGHEFDLTSGYAGAIAALVVLRDILEDASLLGFAAQLGEELLKTADETDAGYSWKSVAFPKRRNLTGFSHGTAGVGYALLELFATRGDSRYLEAAGQAFRYERYWFDAAAGNWPDFREEPGRGKRGKQPLSFATFWCHGAPGIALSRLRAYEVLHDESCKDEAITALQTTREMVGATLRSGIGNYSLCHGLAGNAEVLLYGRKVLGREWADGHVGAFEVANAGIETYADRGLSWPCGTGGGETPSLMLGLAGIGHFYLRLRDQAMPSALILRREDFSNLESPGARRFQL
jgi:hypothetical protein